MMTACMKQVVEPATVLRTGAIYNDSSGHPLKGLEVRFTQCPGVTWGFYLEKSNPGATAMSPKAIACLEKLNVGDKVDVAIDVKPLNKTGGTHGGSAVSISSRRVGKCELRPKEGDDYDGFLSSNSAEKTCPWAREETMLP